LVFREPCGTHYGPKDFEVTREVHRRWTEGFSSSLVERGNSSNAEIWKRQDEVFTFNVHFNVIAGDFTYTGGWIP